MSDLLYNAAVEYQRLQNVVYKIIVGRKGKSYTLQLHFPPESFFHLTGLQHLTDITFPSTNKDRIYKEILSQKFGIRDIRKSIFFDKWYIEERLNNIYYLEKMLDSNSVTYLINGKRYTQYTSIRADYLCKYNMDENILYLFVVRERKFPKFLNECKGCSLFTKHYVDYTIGAARTTTLLIEKQTDTDIIQVFRNPAYKE